MKYRTIAGVIDYIKSIDPETALTTYALRQKVLSGEVPHVKCGAKRLVDIDTVIDTLAGSASPVPEPQSGQIRRIL